MMISKDILMELLKTESVTVIGVLLVMLAVSFIVISILYKKMNALHKTHKEEIEALHKTYNGQIKTIQDEYIAALNNHSEKLENMILTNEKIVKNIKDVINE